MRIKGAIFDLDGTLLNSMGVWNMPYSGKSLYTAYNGGVFLKDGAYDFLKKLYDSRIKFALATATDRFLVEPALKHNKIYDFFEIIFTCSEVGAKKTTPLIYERALDFLGFDKSEVLVFEDAYYAAETAKRAGFTVVGVYDEWEEDDISELCDAYVKSWLDADFDALFGGRLRM